MTTYEMDGNSAQQNKRAIILGILGGAVIIGIGLAIGLAIGLRSRGWVDPDGDKDGGQKPEYKSAHGHYRYAAVACDSKICSKIGTDVMARDKGNAVDATVATVLCNGVVHSHSSGIGGGAFFLFYNRTTRKVETINAREKAPRLATVDMYVNKPSLSTLGGKAVAVPGELKGLWTLHRRYGRLPWSSLVQPVIRLAREGVELTGSQHTALLKATDYLVNNIEFGYLFNDDGKPYPVGHKIIRRKLADTLQIIADKGADAFYNGSLTNSIVSDLVEHGSIISAQDLWDYNVEISNPLTFNLGGHGQGHTLHTMPLPSGGLLLTYVLNILSGCNLTPESTSTVDNSVLFYHRFVEAMKFAFATRSQFGDPDFVNMTQMVANLTLSETGRKTLKKIDDVKTHDTSYYGAVFDDGKKVGTSHICIVDTDGNVVSLTTTINLYYGSKVKGRRTGIIFNNEMDDFSTPNTTNSFGLPASKANLIAPGKRPMSSMTPTLVLDDSGQVVLVVGASGGTMISSAVALVILKTLFLNETVTSAVDSPRLHHQLLPKDIAVEKDFPLEIQSGLAGKGHKFRTMGLSVVIAIHRTRDNLLEAVSDWRKGGAPDGF